MTNQRLWYDTPAEKWTEALPLGNGFIGAMVFGGPIDELYRLNDGRAWSGSPANESAAPQIEPEQAAIALASARAAIADRNYATADTALKALQHRYSQSFLPFADLDIHIGSVGDDEPTITDYRRSLDLPTATHTTEYRLDGFPVRQRSFASHRANVLVIEIESGNPSGLSLQVGLSSQLRVAQVASGNQETSLELRMPSDVAPKHDDALEPVTYSADDLLSLQGALVVRAQHDGIQRTHADPGAGRASMEFFGVRSLTLYVATDTTFTGLGKVPAASARGARERAASRTKRANRLGARALADQHLADHSQLYGRVTVDTGEEPNLPTDLRLRRDNSNPAGILASDPGLVGLMFNYGRYLLISSSRVGGTPANLQGIWNDSLQPPWSSNYTTNINLQMNYWSAEVADLPECIPPLFDLIDALVVTGTRTAARLYGAPGWVAHHNTDIWAYSQPVGMGDHDPKWSFWPFAGAWLVRHLWEHLLYGASDDFARTRAYGPIRSASEFYLSWLTEQPDGSLGTTPSTSPENQFITPDGVVASTARSSAFDLVVIRDLLQITIDIAARLNITNDPVVTAAKAAIVRIAEPTIGRDGMVQEWSDDFAFPDPQHRHVAHLYFVYPSDWALPPQLAAAASASLDGRGDESTGWSLVWKLAMRARLAQPQRVASLLSLMLRDMDTDRGPWIGGVYPNLFTAHPPFQIDANLGFVAAVSECIVQSHRGEIELLNAVPDEIPSGNISGLIARPGVTVSVTWRADQSNSPALSSVTLTASRESGIGEHLVVYRGQRVRIDLAEGSSVTLTHADFEQATLVAADSRS